MPEAHTIPAKHIFLDVVGFTHNRSVEAQSDIVHYLNAIVQSSVSAHVQADDKVIYLPTGDGLCICLLNVETPYDVHILIAKDIVSGIYNHNNSINSDMRKFHVRIGINQNIDNLVTDVNGNQNIAGAGINMAARVMTMADDDQILVAESVHDTLRYREKYMNMFRSYIATVKHGVRLPVYQFIEDGCAGLNIDIPKAFQYRQAEKLKLSKHVAYYFAYATKYRDFFIERKQFINTSSSICLLWLLASDSVEKSETSEIDTPFYLTYEFEEATFENQYQHYHNMDYHTIVAISRLVRENHLLDYNEYFEGLYEWRFINAEGREKLKREWPDIWNEFELDNSV